jgi:hypothetical protein
VTEYHKLQLSKLTPQLIKQQAIQAYGGVAAQLRIIDLGI